MGGTSKSTYTSQSRTGTQAGEAPGAGGGAGGGALADCPAELYTSVTGTDRADALEPNTLLDVALDQVGQQRRVVLVDPVRRKIVGSIAGIPGLATLIACLEAEVVYRATVTAVDGGRVDVQVLRQG